MLREELQLLQEQGSYVGEVVKPMDKKKVSTIFCLVFYITMHNTNPLNQASVTHWIIHVHEHV